MKLMKWKASVGKYVDYEVPDSWRVRTFCTHMDEVVNCAHCGKELPYGDCYTSREIHNLYGIGYVVCESCYYEKEVW